MSSNATRTSLGITPPWLAELRATDDRQQVAGIGCLRYVSRAPVAANRAAVAEVCWSAERVLPLRVVRGTKAEWIQEVVAVQRGVDEKLLRNPEVRFPDYLAMDMVDWREEDHAPEGHAGTAGAGH